METEVSKEEFIEEFECLLRIMSKFLEEGKIDCFETAQMDYSSLLTFAYVHDLLSDAEYARYKPCEFCGPQDFVHPDKLRAAE